MSESIKLAPRLDLSAAAALKETLLEAADRRIVLDFAEVKLFGALCLQIVLAAARAAKAQGHDFVIENVPDRVSEQMRVMGVSPQVISGGDL